MNLSEGIEKYVAHKKNEGLVFRTGQQLILAFWFGPATAVKFGPLGRHWLGFMDGATEG